MSSDPIDQPEPLQGYTQRGVAWRWMTEPLISSRLLLYPDVPTPSDDDVLRAEQSRRVRRLFADLQLPVSVEWVPPAPHRPEAEWTPEDDLYPSWVTRPGERHAFLFSIVANLWESLRFAPAPPLALVQEWWATVGSEFDRAGIQMLADRQQSAVLLSVPQ